MLLTKSQAKALKTFIAERDAAVAGVADVLIELGLDPKLAYKFDLNAAWIEPPDVASETEPA